MRVASMGYPDIIAQVPAMDGLVYREDSDAICKRHGIPKRPIPDAHSYFGLHGCKLDVYDIVRERGCEIILDLNGRVDPILKAWGYDIVLDVGTLEHCFNIGQAIVNMAGMVKHGGHIIHENPFNWGNHGFYGLQPTFYADFYKANGFEVVELCLATRDGLKAPAPHGERFRFTEAEVNAFCVARRVAMQSFTWPVQHKYAKSIPAAGVPGELKEVANGIRS
jgi:hypothetical protein